MRALGCGFRFRSLYKKTAPFLSGRSFPLLVFAFVMLLGCGEEAQAHNFSDSAHVPITDCQKIPGSFSVHAVARWAPFTDGRIRTRFDVCIKGASTNVNPYDEGFEIEVGRLVNGRRVPYEGTWNFNGGFGINMYDANWEGTADHREAEFFEQSFGLVCVADDPNTPDGEECPMNNDPEDNNNLVPRNTLIYLKWKCGGADEPACPSGFSGFVKVQAHNGIAQGVTTNSDETEQSGTVNNDETEQDIITNSDETVQGVTVNSDGTQQGSTTNSDETVRDDTTNSGGTKQDGATNNNGSPAKGTVTISGTPQVGQTLTASLNNVSDPDGLGDDPGYDHQWIRIDSSNDETSVGSGTTYMPTEDDVGHRLKVVVTFSDSQGSREVLESSPTSPVTPASPGTPQGGTGHRDDGQPGLTLSETSLSVPEGGWATYAVKLSTQPDADVTVEITGTTTSVGVSDSSLTFTTSDWNQPRTVTVTARDDDVDREYDPVTLVHSTTSGDPDYDDLPTGSVTVTVVDNDTIGLTISKSNLQINEGDEDTYTVALKTLPSADVTVDITGATEYAGIDLPSLTFTASDWNRPQTVTVTARDDDVDREYDPVTLVHSTTSGDPDYDDLPTGSVTVTVVDNDTMGLTISKSNLQINEGDKDTYTVALKTLPSADVTVDITGATEYASIDLPSLTFTASDWNRPQTVTVTAGDDDVDREYDPVTLVHVLASSDQDYADLPQNVRVTIIDSEMRGVVVSEEKLTVSEESEGSYTLVLTSEPTAPVMIAVMSSNAVVKASPDNLTFTDSNWDVPQTVTVMARASDAAELTHQVTSMGDYASVTVSSVQVNERRLPSVNDELLPRITQAMMSSTLSAISRRIDMANPNVDSEGPYTFDGQVSLEQALASLAIATRGATSLDLRRVLDGKEFVLPFNAAEGKTKSTVEAWGRGDYRNLEGGDDRPTQWDGDLASIHVGVDWKVRPGLLAGVMMSWSDGKFDYQNRGDPREGTYDSELTSVHPYVSWMSFENALQVWATVGYGRGEIEINDGSGKYSSDTRLKTAAVGASTVLASEHNTIMFGTSTLRLKAEGNVTEIKADGGNGINPLTADIERARVVLEGRHVCERGPGEWLIPWVEVGARHDGGDGLTGTGMEIGTGVRYSNAAKGLTVEGEARYLINHSDDYDEWGFHGEVRVDPGADGRGLSFSLAPSLGRQQRNMASLWARDGPGMLPTGERDPVDAEGRLDAQLEYGLPAVEGRGLLTPYAHVSLAGGDGEFRIGSRLQVGPTFSLNVEGGRFGEVEGSSDIGVGLFVQLHF